MQLWLLNQRFEQQQQIVWRKEGAVQDRSIYEDTVFAAMLTRSGHISQRDFQTYLDTFKNMSKFMSHPNMLIYLNVSPEISMARIKERGRACEKGITLEYLTRLHEAYTSFIQHISKTVKVIQVDWTTFQSPEVMAKKIYEKYKEMSIIQQIVFYSQLSGFILLLLFFLLMLPPLSISHFR
jgi:deoxyadenosine kinase